MRAEGNKKSKQPQPKPARQENSVLDHILDPIARFNRDLQLIYINPAFLQLTGNIQEEVIGKTSYEIGIPSKIATEWEGVVKWVFETGSPGEMSTYYPVGEEIVYLVTKMVPEPDETGTVQTVLAISRDVSEIKKSESEELQAFLLQLSDALRPLFDPAEIQHVAMQVLGQWLGVNRAQYYLADETGEYLSSSGGYTDGVPAAVGRFRLIEFGKYAYDGFHAGQTQVVSDATIDSRISETVLRSYKEVGFLAYIGVPFVQRGRLIGTVAVHQSGTRQWTDNERIMVEETAERAGIAIEHARAQEALSKSEEKYRSLYNSIDEGSYQCEVIFDENSKPVDILYLTENAAAIRMLGQSFEGKRLREINPLYEEYWYRIWGDVALTGISTRQERYSEADGKWFSFFLSKVEGKERQVVVLFSDITERKRRELSTALLAEIGKDLSLLNTAEEMMYAVGLKLTEFMNLTGCVLTDVDEERGEVTAHYGFTEGVSLLQQTFVLNEYVTPEFIRICKAGEAFIVNDTATDDRLNAEGYAQLGIGALVTIPFFHKGKWTNYIGVTSTATRQWKKEEIELLWEIAERLFSRLERVRTEEALRKSEEKYRTLFDTMDEALSICRVIRDDTGKAVDLRYLAFNNAHRKHTGLDPDTLIGRYLSDVLTKADVEKWIPIYERIANSRNPESFEDYVDLIGRWYMVSVYPDSKDEVSIFYRDITERKNREQEQALLLKLGDSIKQLTDPVTIEGEVTSLLCEHFDAGWCYYVEWDEVNKMGVVSRDAARKGLPSLVGKHDVSDVPGFLELLNANPLVNVSDYENYEMLTPGLRQRYIVLGFRSVLIATLVKQDRLVASLLIGDDKIRHWSKNEETLLMQVAERTWAAKERAKAEEALRKSEEKYRSLFETADEGFCLMELIPNKQGYIDNMVYLETNQSYARLTGSPDVVGKSTKEVLPNLEQEWWDVINRVYQTGLSERIENEAVDFSRWFSVHFSRVGQKEDKRLALVFDNITDRKRREQQQAFLLKLSDTLRTVSDADSIATLAVNLLADELNLGRCYIVARRQVEEGDLWDIGAEFRIPALPPMPPVLDQREFPGTLRIITEETLVYNDTNELPGLTEMEKKGLQALGFGGLVMGVLRRGENNPSWAMVAASVEPRQWTTGEVALIQEVAERTWAAVERAKAEEALRQSEEQLKKLNISLEQEVAERTADLFSQHSLLKQAEEIAEAGSWEYNVATKEFTWSDGMYELFKIKKGSLVIPAIYRESVIEEDRAAAERIIAAIQQQFRSFEEIIRIHADGNTKIIRIKATPFFNANGGVEKMLGVDADISRSVEAEQEIRLLNRTLTDKNRVLESLNTDLKSFTGIAVNDYSETLRQLYLHMELIVTNDARNLSNSGRANLRRAQSAIQKMKLITDDLVSFFKLQQIGVREDNVELDTILKEVIREFTELPDHAGIDVRCDQLPVVSGYPFLLSLMFQHLVDNAIKFRKSNEQHQVHITCEKSVSGGRMTHPEAQKDRHYHVVAITDNGIGFPPEEAEPIFGMFYRLHDKRRYKGSGIGLAISRKIMQMHGGFITAEAQPGQGARFSCYFPA